MPQLLVNIMDEPGAIGKMCFLASLGVESYKSCCLSGVLEISATGVQQNGNPDFGKSAEAIARYVFCRPCCQALHLRIYTPYSNVTGLQLVQVQITSCSFVALPLAPDMSASLLFLLLDVCVYGSFLSLAAPWTFKMLNLLWANEMTAVLMTHWLTSMACIANIRIAGFSNFTVAPRTSMSCKPVKMHL
jgi:hypothetical protein